jgi:uncharacterized protein with NRDE domain
MCLILFAYRVHPQLPLVVAANRDEFHARPSAAAGWWADDAGVYAGRDLQDGGTWVGVHRAGRFAAVTNFAEEPPPPTAALRSRGELTTGFLRGTRSPADYLAEVAGRAMQYRGFNLLLGDFAGSEPSLHFFGNRDGGPRALPPGVYGMSNDVLDCDWPKVNSGKRAISEALADLPTFAVEAEALELQRVRRLTDALFAVLGDRHVPPDELLPKRGRDIEMERRVAPSFVTSELYGTRASTVILVQRTPSGHEMHVAERRFGPLARELGRGYRTIPIAAAARP